MAKRGVSSKTHNQKQLDDYANQHNPNNKAYQARINNAQKSKKVLKYEAKQELRRQARFEAAVGLDSPLDWMCYSNPYDFD
ncbi:hypothetical protein CIY_13720 [Butyrivibrio fibrisolvens 16/4]|nr:hypothetical protein CIY_13720 [Butyrivibrio fibrisolvens 16/4]